MEKYILYVTRIINGKNHIFEKIKAQCHGFEEIGMHVDLACPDENYNLILNGRKITSLYSKIGMHFLFFRKLMNVDFNKYDYIYLRDPFLLSQFAYLLFLFKAKRSKVKVILEIPTFPYSKELIGFYEIFVYIIQLMSIPFLRFLISKIVYSGNSTEKIYGVPAVQLSNIGNIHNIPLVNSKSQTDRLVLISVSGCMLYHGIDRIIVGLHKYYSGHVRVRIEFIVIGSGPCINSYIQMVDNYSLQDFVYFIPPTFGEELDMQFNRAHIGISALAMHRIGLVQGSPIKTAEYAYRGLPIILSYRDSAFNGKEFCYVAPSDESSIDLNEVINWYYSLDSQPDDLRTFVVDNISWASQFKTIINSL